MDVVKIDDIVSVSEQITEGDVALLAEKGVKLVICNRPDNESADQVNASDIQQACEQQGIAFTNIPFVMNELGPAHVEAFKQAIAGFSRVHAYCRSGNRSSVLYAQTKESP